MRPLTALPAGSASAEMTLDLSAAEVEPQLHLVQADNVLVSRFLPVPAPAVFVTANKLKVLESEVSALSIAYCSLFVWGDNRVPRPTRQCAMDNDWKLIFQITFGHLLKTGKG